MKTLGSAQTCNFVDRVSNFMNSRIQTALTALLIVYYLQKLVSDCIQFCIQQQGRGQSQSHTIPKGLQLHNTSLSVKNNILEKGNSKLEAL